MKRLFLLAPTVLLFGCGAKVEQYVLPDQVTDFTVLYQNSCAGCHGQEGRAGVARRLNDPVFLAVIGKENLHDVIANGVPRTGMPAFAQAAGGSLTDQQITILANQIEEQWAQPNNFTAMTLPPYRADLGDPKAGEAAFGKYCATCHGQDGTGGSQPGSVVDQAFLSLVSNQSLRSTVIAGCGGEGAAGERKSSPAHGMAPQEISDVVAWLSAQRFTPVNLTQRGTNLK